MDEWEKLRFEHAQRHFSIHAGQRMSLFQFALAFWAGIYAALATARQYHLDSFAHAAALAGIGATIAFWLLDQRTRVLIKTSEAALEEIEQEIAEKTHSKAIRILAGGGRRRRWWPLSYTQSFRIFYLANVVAMSLIGFPRLFDLSALGSLWPQSP